MPGGARPGARPLGIAAVGGFLDTARVLLNDVDVPNVAALAERELEAEVARLVQDPAEVEALVGPMRAGGRDAFVAFIEEEQARRRGPGYWCADIEAQCTIDKSRVGLMTLDNAAGAGDVISGTPLHLALVTDAKAVVDLLLRHGAAVPAGPVIRDATPFASHFQAYAKLRFEATLELTELATPQDLDFVRAALGTALAPAEFSRLRTLALASRIPRGDLDRCERRRFQGLHWRATLLLARGGVPACFDFANGGGAVATDDLPSSEAELKTQREFLEQCFSLAVQLHHERAPAFYFFPLGRATGGRAQVRNGPRARGVRPRADRRHGRQRAPPHGRGRDGGLRGRRALPARGDPPRGDALPRRHGRCRRRGPRDRGLPR